jgi:hypothetical protein
MRGNPVLFRSAAMLLALALTVAACDSTSTATTTTSATPSSTTTTTGSTSTTAPEGTAGEADVPIVTASEGIDEAVVAELTVQIQELIRETEELRGLPFLTQPAVAIVTPDELAARVRSDLEDELDSEELAVDTRLYRLLGLLQPGDELEPMLLDLYSEQVAGFYDGDTEELVIAGDAADLTPLTKSVVVHELVHALTDQHFLFNGDFEAMFDDQRYDQAAAFQALIEGDATYAQLLYVQQLSPADQTALALEALEQLDAASVINSVPTWVQEDLSFPYDNGQLFVQSLVEDGGLAAIDKAYVDRPVSTEAIMHPASYSSGEGVLPVDPVSITLDGYEVEETSVFGEWGFRLLLSEAAPGVAAQAAAGWGGDSYQVLFDNDDVLIGIAYKGDTENDAFELADALIAHASETMELGEPLGEGGGVEFTAEDGRYVFLDRIGDGFRFVASTDAEAGRAAKSQLRVP